MFTELVHLCQDYVYEEIQDHVRNPDSETTTMTVYAAANLPTNPSDSLSYSTINFQKGSDRAGGEQLLLKPSSTACEYSGVRTRRPGPDQPPRSPEEPLYSTVNKPRQQ